MRVDLDDSLVKFGNNKVHPARKVAVRGKHRLFGSAKVGRKASRRMKHINHVVHQHLSSLVRVVLADSSNHAFLPTHLALEYTRGKSTQTNGAPRDTEPVEASHGVILHRPRPENSSTADNGLRTVPSGTHHDGLCCPVIGRGNTASSPCCRRQVWCGPPRHKTAACLNRRQSRASHRPSSGEWHRDEVRSMGFKDLAQSPYCRPGLVF